MRRPRAGFVRHPLTGRSMCSWWKHEGCCHCAKPTRREGQWLSQLAARIALAFGRL